MRERQRMLGKYAATYLVLVEGIDMFIETLEKNPPKPSPEQQIVLAIVGKDPPLLDQTKKGLKTVIVEGGVTLMTTRIEMPSVTAQVRRIDYALEGDVGAPEMIGLLKELRTRIFDELNERQFF
jgi:hypothetical protein